MDDLAKKCRQLAERCHRLSELVVDTDWSAALKGTGDQMMAYADALETFEGFPEPETIES
jgi:hypothetical protein